MEVLIQVLLHGWEWSKLEDGDQVVEKTVAFARHQKKLSCKVEEIFVI